MKTFVPKIKKGEVRNWYVLDANGKKPGKIATGVANILRGKSKPTYTPFLDTGDYVIIINCEKIALTEKRLSDKKYYRHSSYGKDGLKTETARQKMENDPTFVLWHAIRGMIPRNKLRDDVMNRLKLFVGNEHNHVAQNPKLIEIN